VKVFAFEQAGVRYALPQPRVARVADAPRGASLIAISDQRELGEWQMCVEVSVDEESVWLPCTSAKLVEVTEPRPLPALLRDAIGLPHVVGWADLADEIVWLLDARKLAPPQREGGATP
jgi:hypothetical protein